MYTKQKIKKCIIGALCFCLLSICVPVSVYGAETTNDRLNSKFRAGAYFHYSYKTNLDDIRFDKLDYIVYAFVEPYADGSFRPLENPDQLKDLIERAHTHGVKVFMGIGGGSTAMDFDVMASDKNSIIRFIKSTMGLFEDYDLDGIDIDWESPLVGESAKNCESVMQQLSKELKAKGKYFTVAVSGTYKADQGIPSTNGFTDACLDCFDWIHVMTYSLQRTNSPLWFPDVSLQYWHNIRGISTDRLVIGVPFYALPSWKTYRDLIAEDPEYAYIDQVLGADETQESNYNGINTIREKTKLGLQNGGGMFSWVINVDAAGEQSLTALIYDTIKEAQAMGVSNFVNKPTVVYKNREIMYDANSGYPFIDAANRTMVPFRKSAEAVGMTVSYDAVNQVAKATGNGKTIQIPIGQPSITVNGQTIALDTQAVIYNNRTYIPMRAFFENAGCTIKQWHNNTRTAYVE
ncbi:glycosyl hydrolase family 18 protein [Sinanaerobacter sp. ZZT-01]|uniref:glycosyl hydrolase family 18 protein n=1 Tax=Sinanaerobacter sp. ZZT-01 TaxID=3111540 RepID=UPI002D773BBF|nr:glycosyl hydrolase family 18 protein [Sinanaerobacter sp. ZZT-01]WRR93099.1 glycosyl hydrolase family 18 protein [Sinanaerobacter sp. ZZT-01]